MVGSNPPFSARIQNRIKPSADAVFLCLKLHAQVIPSVTFLKNTFHLSYIFRRNYSKAHPINSSSHFNASLKQKHKNQQNALFASQIRTSYRN